MRNIYLLNSRFTLPFAFVLAVSLLAVSLMFMLPGGLLHAQVSDETIKYPENGTGPVTTFTAIDPEGESIVWSLEDMDDMDDFEIDNGVLRFKSSPDYEAPADADNNNTYVVTVQASDGGTVTTAMEEVTVEVTNVEEPGTVMLSALQPQVGVDIVATLTDPDTIDAADRAAVTWQWYRGNTPIAGATIATVTGDAPTSTYTPAAGDIGSRVSAKAMYDDDEGDDKMAEQESAHAAREAPTSNVPPRFPIPAGQSNTAQTREIAENTPAGTNIGAPVAASDTDVLTYSLDGTDAGNFDINRATGHIVTKEPLNHEESGGDSHTVMVTATDPFQAVAEVTVTISVTDVNEAPELMGAATIDIAENETDLSGAGTADQYAVTDEDDEDDVSDDADMTWTLSGADSSKFNITTTGATRTISFKEAEAPNFESPGDSGANNVYDVTVMVTDTDGNTDSQAVMVKVTNVEEMGVITLSTLQPRVGFLVTATLADPDNVDVESLEWQWYRGSTISIDANNFEDFNPTTLPQNECDATTTTNCSIKDATSGSYVPVSADVGNSLTAIATYTDGNANEADGKDYAATSAANNPLVSTTNEAPKFMDQDPDTEGDQTAQERSIAEGTAAEQIIGDVVTAMDEDTNLTYALGGPDAGSFNIVRASGQLQTKAALDKEDKDTYTVTVTATDSLGASSTITVTINVTDVDEMPELTGEAPEEYAENGTAAVATFRATDPEGKSITWSLTGSDAEDFSIEGGVLRFEDPPDYETPADNGTDNTYEVTINASDGGQDTTTATMEVEIEVTNVDEPGTVMLSTLQPQVGVEITATLDDPDNQTVNTVTWQWYRGRSPISGETEGGSSNESDYTPTAGDIGSSLRAEAMYDDAEDEDKSAQGTSFRSVRAAPGSNTPPVFPDQELGNTGIQTGQTREVNENTAAGTNIGPAVSANDPGDLLTYSLSGTGAASFDIVRSSGQIRTKSALDFETTSTYTVMVTATDPSDAPVTAEVEITVTDVNEDPTFTDGATSIDHIEGTTVLDDDSSNDSPDAAEYMISDQDNADNAANLDWDLTGADADKFELTDTTATRTLSFKDAPDFESPGDSGSDNVYNVTVEVTDSDGNTAERAVTVKVTNREEDGTIELSTLQPRIGFPITATLTDADNITAGSVAWQWYKGNVTQQLLAALDNTECVVADTNSCFIKGATSATYTPVAIDVQDTLVAVALYTDGSPNDPADVKDFAMMVTAQPALADTRNKAPVFPDQDTEMEGDQTDQTRMAQENAPIIGDNERHRRNERCR